MLVYIFTVSSAVGKLHRQQLTATSSAGPSSTSRLFYITDRTTGTRFLVDTGADVSVIPPSAADKRRPSSYTLQAVNQSAISTFGEKSMTLDIGFRCSYRWIFIIADIPIPILGADFLANFGLEVDVRNRQLIDTITDLRLRGISFHFISFLIIYTWWPLRYRDLVSRGPC